MHPIPILQNYTHVVFANDISSRLPSLDILDICKEERGVFVEFGKEPHVVTCTALAGTFFALQAVYVGLDLFHVHFQLFLLGPEFFHLRVKTVLFGKYEFCAHKD